MAHQFSELKTNWENQCLFYACIQLKVKFSYDIYALPGLTGDSCYYHLIKGQNKKNIMYVIER